MLIRIRSRDGLERVQLQNPSASVGELKQAIEAQLGVAVHEQALSRDQNLLLAKGWSSMAELQQRFPDMVETATPLAALGVGHGAMLFLAYGGERNVAAATAVTPAGTFGRKMTIDDLIARQIRVERQETPPRCASASFDRGAANAFQMYVNEALAFAVARGGFLYGRVDENGEVLVDFIYEPPQSGAPEDALVLLRDAEEERHVEAVAAGLGMRRVGFILAQAVGARSGGDTATLSRAELRLAAELHAEAGLDEFVTAIVKLEVNDDGGGADVHFEAFQLSEQCVKLFRDGLFMADCPPEVDSKYTRMTKPVVCLGKDTTDVDNDFFIVPVKIVDHQGILSTGFPIENRSGPVTLRALKSHLERTRNVPYVKRISDFHLLLLLAKYLDVNADVPQLAACVQFQATVPEGYQLIIESLANSGT